jgi:hypothetical protein
VVPVQRSMLLTGVSAYTGGLMVVVLPVADAGYALEPASAKFRQEVIRRECGDGFDRLWEYACDQGGRQAAWPQMN